MPSDDPRLTAWVLGELDDAELHEHEPGWLDDDEALAEAASIGELAELLREPLESRVRNRRAARSGVRAVLLAALLPIALAFGLTGGDDAEQPTEAGEAQHAAPVEDAFAAEAPSPAPTPAVRMFRGRVPVRAEAPVVEALAAEEASTETETETEAEAEADVEAVEDALQMDAFDAVEVE